MATKKNKRRIKLVPRKSRSIIHHSKSFKIVQDRTPFLTYQITQQTVYWTVLFIYILILSLWILNIQLDTLRIIEKINTI